MSIQQELQRNQKEWLELGEARGEKKANRTAVLGFYAQGLSISNIAKGLNLTTEQVEEILSSYSDDSDENTKN